jgi:hypothetical protein
MLKLTLAAIGAALMFAPVAQAADDGDDYKFVLINKSTVDAIQFFTTKKAGGWSNDWLKLPIKPGEKRPLTFFKSDDDRCTIKTRIVFADKSEFNNDVDYCGISSVIVTDETMFTD